MKYYSRVSIELAEVYKGKHNGLRWLENFDGKSNDYYKRVENDTLCRIHLPFDDSFAVISLKGFAPRYMKIYR